MKKCHVFTVQIIIKSDVEKEDVEDFVSDLLSENTLIEDWAYIEYPEVAYLPNNYDEGEFWDK